MKGLDLSFGEGRSQRLSRRCFLKATGFAAAVSPAMACGSQNTASLSAFGGVGDGVTDNYDAIRRALSAIGPSGRLYVPPGHFKLYDDRAFQGAPPLILGSAQTIFGDGRQSILGFSRRNLSAFYGLGIAGRGVRIEGLEFRCASSRPGWTAALAITEDSRDVLLRRLAFIGVEGRSGHYGVLPIGADLDHFSMEACHFQGLDFGFLRGTSDTAHYRHLSFIDCVGVDCTEVIEINAPGLLFVNTRAGSNVVDRIADSDGNLVKTTGLKVGQSIRCKAFPAGTRVVGRDTSGRLILSAPSSLSSSPGRPFRLSAGGATHGRISNLVVRDIAQWAVGMANCDDWDVDVKGDNIGYELVHIEDASRNIRLRVSGSNTNLKPGVVGSPKAENGMVQILTGSHNIRVQFDAVDLRRSLSLAPVGICVQPGGIMGTTGQEIGPTAIRIGGELLCDDRGRAVVAFESELIFDDLAVLTSKTGHAPRPRMRLAGCRISGKVRTNLQRNLLIEPEVNAPVGNIEIVSAQ